MTRPMVSRDWRASAATFSSGSPPAGCHPQGIAAPREIRRTRPLRLLLLLMLLAAALGKLLGVYGLIR